MLIERYLEVAARSSDAIALQFSTDEGLQAFSYGEVSSATNRIAEFRMTQVAGE